MKYKSIIFLLILAETLSAFQSKQKDNLTFKTSAGHTIKISRNLFFYDDKIIFKVNGDEILFESRYNRLIEDHGAIFLFIAMAGNPNIDRLNAFLITPSKAILKADAIISPIKDYDDDGYLEFGGSDLTEAYPNTDSMYYIPTAYYEIRDGNIYPDNMLTKSEDIKINGLYLPPNKQLDKDGSCCVVIPKPGKKHKINRKKQ